jgi:hypothetical protein
VQAKTLDEAVAIAEALEPLGYEVYGVEDTWFAGKVPGLAVKVIRVADRQDSVAGGKYDAAYRGRSVKA